MLSKLIENKGKDNCGPCESVLGDLDKVNAAAEFWQNYPEVIQLIALDGLLNYAEEHTFTDREFAAFKVGLGITGSFMQACWDERQAIIKANSEVLPQDSEL
jgi:hypothetical protein